MDKNTELDLVKKAQAGDRDSYGQLADLYAGAVLAAAYGRVGNFAVSQDIAQDAFLLGLENLAKLRQPRRFGLWLRTITKNLCRDWHRSEAYRKRLQKDTVALKERLGYTHSLEAGEELEQKEMRNLIDESLRDLPARDRESLLLYYFEGKSIAEAARGLDISPAAMKKRLERARKRLRDQLSARVEAGLTEAAKRRKMSGRVLAAIPLGASYARIAPVATVIPAAPALHVAGFLAKAGSVIIGVNKTAAVVIALCAALAGTTGGVLIVRGNRAPEEPHGMRTEVAQLVSLQEEPAEPHEPDDSGPPQPTSQPEPSEAAALPQGASISGTVSVSDTGEPIEGATVTVSGGWEATSGADGSYTCVGLRPLEHRVTCEPPGAFVALRMPPRKVPVGPDERVTGIDFTFERGTSISGRVTDTATDGIEGAEFSAMCATDRGKYAQSRTESGKEGEYQLTGIRPNSSYEIRINAEGYAGVFMESLPVPGKAEVTGIDFVLEPEATISGRVVDTEGRPAADIHVGLPIPMGWVYTDDKGAFTARGVTAGTHTFLLSRGRAIHIPAVKNDPITVQAGEKITGIEIIIPAEGEGVIEGHAWNEQSQGIPHIDVQAGSQHARTDDSGHYRIEGLADGDTVSIRFNHPGYVSAHLFDVSVGDTNADIVMAQKGTISGRVLSADNREPIEEFDIAILTDRYYAFGDRRPRSFHSEVGEFVIDNVDPGVVTVAAWADGYGPQEILDIVVESGKETSGLEFYLPQGGAVRGLVVAASDGHPVEGAHVFVGDIGKEQFFRDQRVAAVTGADGSFALGDTALGKQTLWVVHPEFAPTSVNVNVLQGEEAEVTIRIRPPAVIAGYVTRDGVGLEGVAVGLSASYQLSHSTRTDGSGYYELKGLAGGVYKLEIYPDRPGQTGGLTRDAIAIVEVTEGYLTEKDFDLSGSGAVEGYVTLNGEPVSKSGSSFVIAQLLSDSEQIRVASDYDSNGFYRIEMLPPGSYTLRTRFQRWGGAARVQVADGQTARADIDIRTGSAAIVGTVSWPAAYEKPWVVIRNASTTAPISLLEWRSVSGTLAHRACKDDGSFEISDLPAGSFNVTAASNKGEFVAPEEILQTSRIVTLEDGQIVEVNFTLK